MVGTLIALPVLIAAAFLGWWRHRRSLATMWSRHAPSTGPTDAPYRQSDQRVPIAGAGRRVTVLVAVIYALAFVAAVRLALVWVGIQDVVDRGHQLRHMVPPVVESAALQIAIAVQAAFAMILYGRAAGALARRDERVGLAMVVAVFGLAIGLTDAHELRTRDDSYWVVGMIVDDVAYALFSALALIALIIVWRTSQRAPPVAAAAVKPTSRSKVRPTLEVLGALAGTALVAHAFFYVSAHNHVMAQIDGDEDVPVSGKARLSADERYTVWMPEDTSDISDKFETPQGLIVGRTRIFTLAKTKLRLESYERHADDTRPVEAFCPKDEHDLRVVRDGAVESCETRFDRQTRRVVLYERTVYTLTATPVPSKAADFFLASFAINLPKK